MWSCESLQTRSSIASSSHYVLLIEVVKWCEQHKDDASDVKEDNVFLEMGPAGIDAWDRKFLDANQGGPPVTWTSRSCSTLDAEP